MKNNLIIVLLCLFVNIKAFADYEHLKAYKAEVKNQTNIQKMSPLLNSALYYVIDFKDINKMDTYSLEEKYALQLHQCIADGICIFKFKKFKKQHLKIDNIMHRESNIEKIKVYKAYDFKAF